MAQYNHNKLASANVQKLTPRRKSVFLCVRCSNIHIHSYAPFVLSYRFLHNLSFMLLRSFLRHICWLIFFSMNFTTIYYYAYRKCHSRYGNLFFRPDFSFACHRISVNIRHIEADGAVVTREPLDIFHLAFAWMTFNLRHALRSGKYHTHTHTHKQIKINRQNEMCVLIDI